ncbi:MAG TPA: HutD family protein [Candidatus Aquabacterium excrementipullorum]|nr:HutD family protein [Candidatus Aquabacterium excrementipullorum]
MAMVPHVMALPPGLSRFAWSTLMREPWRNGKGWTRAVAHHGEGDGLAWRVSLAEITQASPFSSFAGLERISVLAGGGPLAFQAPDEHWALWQAGDQVSYPGELPMHCSRPAQPARIWNVMTARGRATAEVTVHREGPLPWPLDGHVLLWVIDGECELTGPSLPMGLTLHADEGLSGGRAMQGLQGQLRGANARCLLTHLRA